MEAVRVRREGQHHASSSLSGICSGGDDRAGGDVDHHDQQRIPHRHELRFGLYDDHKSGLALVDHHDDLPHSQPSSWLSADGPRRLPPVLALNRFGEPSSRTRLPGVAASKTLLPGVAEASRARKATSHENLGLPRICVGRDHRQRSKRHHDREPRDPCGNDEGPRTSRERQGAGRAHHEPHDPSDYRARRRGPSTDGRRP